MGANAIYCFYYPRKRLAISATKLRIQMGFESSVRFFSKALKPFGRIILIALLCSGTAPVNSQVVKSVVLDSVVVAAVKSGFNVNDFIEMVKQDTSFLRSFRYLRNQPHLVTGNMELLNKKNHVYASRYREAYQVCNGNRRWIQLADERVKGKFYNRKQEPKLYTAELFDEIFFYEDTLPVLPPSVSISGTTGNNNNSSTDKLKRLVFNPGAPIDGVPVVGKRMAIFDDDVTGYYNYRIDTRLYNDSIPCYVFTCTAKPGTGDYTVVKYLTTFFDRKTFNIVFREYKLQYSGLLFEFDVHMSIATATVEGNVYPSRISYRGFWDLPLRKEERANFDLSFTIAGTKE